MIVVILGLYFTRNQWAGYLLKKEISHQSDGNINLSFSAIHLDIFKKRLTVLNPSLSYKNTYIDSTHTLKLEGSRFKELSIYDLFLWDFAIRNRFICKEFLIVQPSFQLASGDSVKNNVNFNPATWLKIIQDHRLAVIPVKFQVKHIHVKLGKIELGKIKKSGEYGGADYNISIDDLGNMDNSEPSGDVFYKNLKINISNLYRISKQRNFSLKVDSVSYLSSLQEFIITGLHYNSTPKGKDQNFSLNVKRAKINGLLPDTANKTFRITAARWSGGSITFPAEKLSQFFSHKQPNKSFQGLLKIFPFLKFDTLSVDHVHILRITADSDTVLSIIRFNINILSARLSGKAFSNPLRFVTFGSLNTNMDGFYYLNPQKGYKINSKNVSYKSGKQLISASNLTFEKFCPSDEKPIWRISSDQTEVQNFSGVLFREKKPQLLSVKLLSPNIQIWENGLCNLSPDNDFTDVSKKMNYPRRRAAGYQKEIINRPKGRGINPLSASGGLNFNLLDLQKGTLRYYRRKREIFNLSNFNLFAKNLKHTLINGKNSISYDTLYFKAEQSNLANPGSSLKMNTGTIKWIGKDLLVDNLLLKQTTKGNLRSISIPSTTFSNLQLSPLIFERKLSGSEADFYNPNVRIQQQDSLNDTGTIPFNKKQLALFPIKISFSKVFVKKGHLNLTMIHTSDSLNLNTGINLEMKSFKMGYDSEHLISTPSNWTVKLDRTSFKHHHITGEMDSASMSSQRKTMSIEDMSLSGRDSLSNFLFNIKIPFTRLSTVDYPKLFRSDSLVFGKVALQDAALNFTILSRFHQTKLLASNLKETTILFDSLELNHSGFTVVRKLRTSNLKITGKQLNILYKPLFRSSSHDSIPDKDFLKKWDISLQSLSLTDTLNSIRVIADGIHLQSKYSQLFINSIVGGNMPEDGKLEETGKDYAYFKLQHMKFSGLKLKGKKLGISYWTTPEVWVNVLQANSGKKKSNGKGLIFSILNKNAGFINRVHIDSTQFKKLNFSFSYDNRKKLINILDVGLVINDIQIDSTLGSDHPNYLFKDMRMDSHGKSILSGDSMYTFRTRDVRINLPLRRISFDSITVTPRFKKEAFFEKEKTQADRITVYGKSIDFNNFDFTTLLNQKVFHAGNISLNSFNVLFERDKHYPLSDAVRPMPLEMLRGIPYKFKADSVIINHGFISYYEYEKKASNPGIFFINNFNVYFLNVTDDFSTLDSAAVLKIHGSGQMMQTSNLSFVLLMPYFSPDNQFWFSAQTSRTDLSQFNSLAQNVMGISVASGIGDADVQYVTGNDKFAKGNVLFQYKNLKLRLYNRRKAKTNKGLGSPFVNFMLNNLMVRTNNPKFLKPPRKGIVYFKRDSHKSFINYLWKSSFSGVTSTLGFNNRQQRQEKKVEKQETKSEK